MRILVIEDEKKITDFIKRGLKEEGYAVDVAYDGQEGEFLAKTNEYDLILLDLMLPKVDGLSVCKNLRASGILTPIIMLTAKSAVEDRVEGLDAGADDYLTKPFAFEELLARIRALTRRPRPALGPVLEAKGLILDSKNFTVKRSGKTVNLSAKEFALLEYLLRNKGKVLTKEKIIAHVWDYDADILRNTVEVNIKNLRRKLGRPELIQTRRGFGYKID